MEIFWKSFKSIISESTSGNQFTESMANRFYTSEARWLSNFLMKSCRLDTVCAELLMKFVGYEKGCRDCGRFNYLPSCSFCLSQLCDKHMSPCHLCIKYGDHVSGVARRCCANCSCSWCHRGVCDIHMLKCKCGNNICYYRGCGECESCPAFCASNNIVSPCPHGTLCKDYKEYLSTCPTC